MKLTIVKGDECADTAYQPSQNDTEQGSGNYDEKCIDKRNGQKMFGECLFWAHKEGEFFLLC